MKKNEKNGVTYLSDLQYKTKIKKIVSASYFIIIAGREFVEGMLIKKKFVKH